MAYPINLSHSATDLKGWPAAVRFFGFTGITVLILIFITSGALMVASIAKYLNLDLSQLRASIIQTDTGAEELIGETADTETALPGIPEAGEVLKDALPIVAFIPLAVITAILVVPLWLFLIVHIFLSIGYTATAIVLSIVNWIYTLIARKRHEGISNYVRQYITWMMRLNAWILGVTDRMVNVDFQSDKDNDHPIQMSFNATEVNINTAWARALIVPISILLIFHFIFLPIKLAWAFLACWLRWIGCIFSKKMRNKKKENTLAVRYLRWLARVLGYILGIEDAWPRILAKE